MESIIEQEQFRLLGESHGDPCALPFPAGERRDGAFAERLHAAHGIVTLLGPNGCGKSTLLKTMARILKPCAGTVCLESESVHSMNTGLLAKQLAILPQIHAAPEDVTVRQLIEYGRFPSVRPDESHDLAGGDGEVQALDHMIGTVSRGQFRNVKLHAHRSFSKDTGKKEAREARE